MLSAEYLVSMKKSSAMIDSDRIVRCNEWETLEEAIFADHPDYVNECRNRFVIVSEVQAPEQPKPTTERLQLGANVRRWQPRYEVRARGTAKQTANKHTQAMLGAIQDNNDSQVADVLILMYKESYHKARGHLSGKANRASSFDEPGTYDDDDSDEDDEPGLTDLVDEAPSYASNLLNWIATAAVGYALDAIADRVCSDASQTADSAGITDAIVFTGGSQFYFEPEPDSCEQCSSLEGVHDLDDEDAKSPVHPSCGCEIRAVQGGES